MTGELGRPWGSTARHPPLPPLSAWESQVIDAVGSVIAFWGFKHNHGRIWALLYLRDAALTAAELQSSLGLSKGAVSMLTRDLESWEVIDRQIDTTTGSRRYTANTELMRMVARMLRRREVGVIRDAQRSLLEAERIAREEGAAEDVLERIRRMRQLADVMDQVIAGFVRTAQLDFRSFVSSVRAKLRRSP